MANSKAVPRDFRRRVRWIKDRLKVLQEIQHGPLTEPRSLDKPIRPADHGRELRLEEIVEAPEQVSPEEQLIEQDQRDKLLEVMKESLNERELTILRGRFWEDRTLEDIGQSIGLSRERVRQIQQQAFQKLWQALRELDGLGR